MGSGASSQQDQPVAAHQPSRTSSCRGRVLEPGRSEIVKRGSATINPGREVDNRSIRKIRGAVLGRRSACTVLIDKNGFSVQQLRICEGQVITFKWDEKSNDSQGYNVTQVGTELSFKF